MTQSPQLDLSVVIPIGNLKSDLENVIAIVNACQDYKIEVVLVLDNQPPELHQELTSRLSASKSRHVVVTSGHWGNPGTPRNVGKALATRSFIAFWDSDDSPQLTGVVKSLIDLSETSADAVVGRFSIKNENQDNFEQLFTSNRVTKSVARRVISNPGLWRFIFNGESIKSIVFPPYSSAEDQLFLQRFFASKRSVIESNAHVYTYIQGGKSQLTKSKKIADQSIRVLELGLNDEPPCTSEFQGLCDCLVIKQILTILKHGDSREKLKGLHNLQLFWKKVGVRRFVLASLDFLYVKLKGRPNHRFKVKVLLMGGLGNQLFQVAYAIYLNKTEGAEVKLLDFSRNVRRTKDGLPEVLLYEGLPLAEFSKRGKLESLLDRGFGYLLRLNLSSRGGKELRDRFVKLVLSTLGYLKWQSIDRFFIPKNIGWVNWEPKNKSYIVVGYFQSYIYAMNPAVLASLRELSSESDREEIEHFRNLANVEHPLLVHIRLGDYRNEPSFGILSTNYYQNAITSLMKNGEYKSIWVFSDENPNLEEYIPTEFLGLARVFESVGSNSVGLLEIMRLCHGYVIANSTLSWWAASLSDHENARVYYPDPWFLNLATPQNLIPPNWVPMARN
jgi:glycosyltransferase involved in cell wall biosynthesis